MVVKGQQMSNIVNLLYGYQTWSDEPLMQTKNDDDLYGVF